MNKNLALSLIGFLMIFICFVMVTFGWFFAPSNIGGGESDIDVIRGSDEGKSIDISGVGEVTVDYSIRPGELKTIQITANSLSGQTITVQGTRILDNNNAPLNNTAYVTSNIPGTVDFTKFNLTGYTVTLADNNTLTLPTSTSYNLYNGLPVNSSAQNRIRKISKNVTIEETTGDTTTTITTTYVVNLYYPEDDVIYNTNDYYTSDDYLYTGEKQNLFMNMVNNSSIANAIRYYISESSTSVIDWNRQDFIANSTEYVVDGDPDVIYLHLYFDPNAYCEYNNIELRNSNPYLFQSLKVTFIANESDPSGGA